MSDIGIMCDISPPISPTFYIFIRLIIMRDIGIMFDILPAFPLYLLLLIKKEKPR